MSEIIRLVVCQLECHPAFYRDRLAFIEEPFMPEAYESSLSYLGSLGIPITEIQETFRQEYIEWLKKRLERIFAHPLLNADLPSVIVFPEGSIPVECLAILHDVVKDKKTSVVAGSHTILDTIEAKEIYSALGKEDALAKRHTYNHDVTFVFAGNKIHHQKKQGLSPFDRIDVTPLDKPKSTLHPVPIPVGDSQLRMATLVCADALQLPNIKGDYEMVSIVSYTQHPSYFDSFIGTQVENGKVVVYCNDGRFGGSIINLPLDRRPSSFFSKAPFNGRLPRGDALLIVDVSTGELATQVGVVNPKGQWEVKLVASITYEDSSVSDHEVSKELCEIEKITNNQARSSRLESLLKKRLHNTNQRYRLDLLHELSRTGVDAENEWIAYGHDMVLNIPSLVDLEMKFAQLCAKKLLPQFVEADLEPESAAHLQAYLKVCSRRIANLQKGVSLSPPETAAVKDSYVNRDQEISKILSFLDSKNEFLVEVTGLPQIGKSASIGGALSHTAYKKVKRVQLLETSSVEYVISQIGSEGEVRLGMSPWDFVWFENCENLLVSGQWKSSEIERLFGEIASRSQEQGVNVIFESAVELPFHFTDPSVMGKIKVWGFEKSLVNHGVAILERQIRRLNLSPSDIPTQTKERLVTDLGGHPMAIIFCADAIYAEGLTSVLEAVKRGTGFYRRVTDRILDVVRLSEEEKRVLRILSGCRIEAPRDAIAATCDFPPSIHISNLIRQCLIEVVSPNTIRLPGVLRTRFRFNDLDSNTRTLLHKNAAGMYSQIALEHPSRVEFAVEAEYHATSIGQISKVNTGLIDGRIAATKAAYDAQDYRRAHELLKPLLSDKTSLDIIRLSALIDAGVGDLPSALVKAGKVLARNPSDNHLLFVLTKAALSQSRPELGDKLVQAARAAGVMETKVSVMEGRLALRRRDFARAEICFQQAIDSPRREPWAYFFLGRTYRRMGRLPKAIDVLYEGDAYLAGMPWLRTKAKNPIQTELGIVYVLNGDLQSASLLLESLIKQEPDNPEVLYAYWLLIVRRDGVDKASEAFEAFKNAKPERRARGSYHLYYGLFLEALNKPDEANEHFSIAHKYEPYNVYIMIRYAENLFNLAIQPSMTQAEVQQSKNRTMKCAEIIKRIFEFDPDNSYAENLQVDLHVQFGIQLSELD